MGGMRLSELDFLRLLPAFMRDDEANAALSRAVDRLIGEPGKRLNTIRTWDMIDALNDAECDEMAWELNVDWYDPTYPIEVKRELIKGCINAKRKSGTKGAIASVLNSMFNDVRIEEWYEHNGPPYSFRLEATIPEEGITAEQQEKALENIKYYKNVRSWLEQVNYTRESNGHLKAGAYASVAKWVEIWPELVENIELAAEIDAGGTVTMRRQLEVFPAAE